MDGYTWLTKNRHTKQGGGVAIAIRNDIISQVRIIDKVEPDDDTEILWVAVENRNKGKNTHNKGLAIGIFYGPQENECRDKVEKIYSVLTTQINKIKQDHRIVLTGDFNAKLPINKNGIVQELSPNGRYLQQMIDMTKTTPSSITKNKPQWTRRNRNNINEMSVIDYVITDTNENIDEIIIDTEGIYRVKNKNGTETDHETILHNKHTKTNRNRNT